MIGQLELEAAARLAAERERESAERRTEDEHPAGD